MKEQIYKICTQLNDGQIAVTEATEQLLDLFAVSGSLPNDLIELNNQWLEDGDDFEGKEVEGRYAKIYVSRKELDFVHKQQRRQ